MANRNNTTVAKLLTRREAGSVALIGMIAAASLAPTCASAAISSADPIITAIENHRSAFLRRLEACNAMIALEAPEPEQSAAFIAAQNANATARGAVRNAAAALIDIRPTTIGGVVALLTYVDEFNRGGLRLDDGSHSDHEQWPDYVTDDGVETGKTPEMPFAFRLLRNVQAALQSVAASA